MNPAPGAAVLLMARVPRRSVGWVVWRLARGAGVLRGAPGLRFAHVLGSGRGGGFGLVPGFDCLGLFAAFDRLSQARQFAADSAMSQAFRRRAIEGFSAVLQTSSARGSWGGQALAAGEPIAPGAPVAVLTRAAIRPGRAARFWRHAPPSEVALGRAHGCALAVGLGEAPLLRQATFSLWTDTQALEAYARQGAHQHAASAAWQEGHFSEWMFARFQPVQLQGQWHGRALGPLLGPERPHA